MCGGPFVVLLGLDGADETDDGVTFTVRPPSRTFQFSASIDTNVYGPRSKRPVPEAFQHLVQLARHRADLRLGQAHGPEAGGELLHVPRRDAQHRYDVGTTEASAR